MRVMSSILVKTKSSESSRKSVPVLPFESPVRHRPEEPKIIVHYFRYDL